MPIQDLPAKACHDLREADPSIMHLDVRTPEEFEGAYPFGAFNVPVFFSGPGGMQPNPQFSQAVEQLLPDKTQRVILNCAMGGRSRRACEMLEEMGYQQPINMLGGFSGARAPDGSTVHTGWADQGLPVSNHPGENSWEVQLGKLVR